MDDPLVPEEQSKTTKLLIQGVSGATALFILITLIIAFVNGSKDGHAGYVLLGLSLLLFLLSNVVVLYYTSANEEPPMRRIMYVQGLALFLLCVAILSTIYGISSICPAPVSCNSCCQGGGTWSRRTG